MRRLILRYLVLGLAPLAGAIAGDLRARYDLTLNRVLRGGPPSFDASFVLADVTAAPGRRFTNFSGDVSGRYIGALASASQWSGENWPALDRVVQDAIRLQLPDGHFGKPLTAGKVADSDMATLWGNGRMLIGLLEYNRAHPTPDVLRAAIKLGDFLVSIAPRFNDEAVRREYNGERFAVGYICWTQNLEGLVQLYRQTKDRRYLDLSRALAERVDRHEKQHSHGFLTSVRGVIDLYRVTGEKRYLDQAEREWKGVIDSKNLMIGGVVPEMFAPATKRDEGCSEADWLRLTLDLWEVTRKPEYLKYAEDEFFNEFSFNQFPTGDFGHHTVSESGMQPPYARAWWCCTFHGLRAMVAVFRSVFHDRNGAAAYDIPVDGSVDIAGLSLKAESKLQTDGTVRLTVVRADGRQRAVAVRVPEWAKSVKLSTVNAPVTEGYISTSKAWKAGDEIVITYDMSTRVVRSPDGPPRVAVFHGPWLLAVHESMSKNYFDEPSPSNQVDLPQTGDVRLQPVSTPVTTPAFAVPAASFLVSYRPGGYPVQPGAAILRPIAEFTTSVGLGRIDWWLPIRPGVDRLDSNYRN